MAKRSTKEPGGARSRDAILEAAVAEVLHWRGADLTTDAVAARVGCAKGLVHYHFRTKEQLLAAVAAKLWASRQEAWGSTLKTADAKDSIAAAWGTLLEEGRDGTALAAATLGARREQLVVQSVNDGRDEMAASLTSSVRDLLTGLQLRTSVPAEDLSALLLATIEGLGLRIAGGADPVRLEPAWAAFWAGLLSFASPRGS
jgi:AcrR family transcriptional regulator